MFQFPAEGPFYEVPMSATVVTTYVRPQREYQVIACIKALPGLLGWMKFDGTVNDHADRMIRFEFVLGEGSDPAKAVELLGRAATSKTIDHAVIFTAPVTGGRIDFTF